MAAGNLGSKSGATRNGGAAAVVRVKVCGITSLGDALEAVEAGADALGFNFWDPSPRRISLDRAAAIIRALPPFVAPVAIFVDPGLTRVREALGACRWGALQFGGDEGEDLLQAFPADLVIRTARLKDRGGLKAARAIPRCAAVLVDAAVPGRPGGTGVRARWDLARDLARRRKVLLAGGLNPKNVAEAVRAVRPYGVDVASGVESSPGKKDPALLRAFVGAAKGAARNPGGPHGDEER